MGEYSNEDLLVVQRSRSIEIGRRGPMTKIQLRESVRHLFCMIKNKNKIRVQRSPSPPRSRKEIGHCGPIVGSVWSEMVVQRSPYDDVHISSEG